MSLASSSHATRQDLEFIRAFPLEADANNPILPNAAWKNNSKTLRNCNSHVLFSHDFSFFSHDESYISKSLKAKKGCGHFIIFISFAVSFDVLAGPPKKRSETGYIQKNIIPPFTSTEVFHVSQPHQPSLDCIGIHPFFMDIRDHHGPHFPFTFRSQKPHEDRGFFFNPRHGTCVYKMLGRTSSSYHENDSVFFGGGVLFCYCGAIKNVSRSSSHLKPSQILEDVWYLKTPITCDHVQ